MSALIDTAVFRRSVTMSRKPMSLVRAERHRWSTSSSTRVEGKRDAQLRLELGVAVGKKLAEVQESELPTDRSNT